MSQQLSDTLIEMVQGPNRENIEQLMRFKVVDNARDVLESFSSNEIAIKRGFASVNDDKIFQFKSNAVNILISLLEGQQNLKLAKPDCFYPEILV